MAIMSIADALKAAIAEEMRRDPTVYCLGEDEDILRCLQKLRRLFQCQLYRHPVSSSLRF